MQSRILLILASLAGCASSTFYPDDEPTSVRERLESADTRLFISGTDSTGSITAARRISGGWSSGAVDLSITSGELVARANADGTVTIVKGGVWLGPIAIPESLIGHGAQLTNVHLELAKPLTFAATWDSEDEAHATTALQLDLSWQLAVDGSSSPLGAPDLAPVPVELVLRGDAEHVDVEVRAHSPGELWSWADLVKLEDLSLDVRGALVTE